MTNLRSRITVPTMRRFDLKFGPDLLVQVPKEPGVYRFFDAAGEVVYVGKAKDLRRRLAQYRTARGRRGKKPRLVVKDAVELAWETHASELDAAVAEIRLIQELKPRHNVAGAYDHLYPYIGARVPAGAPNEWRLCLTTRPELFPEYTFHGAFRSRETTVLALLSLGRLLRHVAHAEPKRRVAEATRDEHAIVMAFRQVPRTLPAAWLAFFRGEASDAMGDLAVRLLERASARHKAADVEADLQALRQFWQDEAAPLRAVVAAAAFPTWPVPQRERDPLFLRWRGGALANAR